MKYPLDNQGIDDIARDILLHHRAQAAMVDKLVGFLAELISESDPDAYEPYDEVQKLVRDHRQRKIEFENHRFNQQNGHDTHTNSPFPAQPTEQIGPIDVKKEAELNAHEAQEFGGEMSEEEIARMFAENAPRKEKKKKKKEQKLNKMSMEEIENWEAAQDNSNDIYKVSARIKNMARAGVKANLTPQGDMVCNTFTHLVKGIYDLAETVHDRELRMKLTQFARKQEEAPAGLIAALSAGVRAPT
jgi:hypothetical protein